MLARSLYLLILLTVLLNACAQSKTIILTGKAFYQEYNTGNQMVDDSGNNLNTKKERRDVYLETSENVTPKIDSAWIAGRLYQASVYPVETIPVDVGRSKSTGGQIILEPPRGKYLWKIELVPATIDIQHSIKEGILLIGKYNGKRFRTTIREVIELTDEVRN